MEWKAGSQTTDAFRYTRRRFLALGALLAGSGLGSGAGAQEQKRSCEDNILVGNWRVVLQRADSNALVAALVPAKASITRRKEPPATADFRIILGQYTAAALTSQFSGNSDPGGASKLRELAGLARSELAKLDSAKPLIAFKQAKFTVNLTEARPDLGKDGVLECDLQVEGPNKGVGEKGKIGLSSTPDVWNAVEHEALTDLSEAPSIAKILRSDALANRFELIEPKSKRAGELTFTLQNPEIGKFQYRVAMTGYEDAIALAMSELTDAASGKTGRLCVPAASGGGSGGGGCFITTAVCHGLGLPDDCFELRVLRRFRDTRLRLMPGGEDDIRLYAEIAPGLAAAIRKKNSAFEFARIYFRWILPSVCYAALGLNERARSTYTQAIRDAASRYA